MWKSRIKFVFLITFLILFAGTGLSQRPITKKSLTVAVVVDGPSEENEIYKLIKPELEHLLGKSRTVIFIVAENFNAHWDPSLIRQVILNAENDRAVDLILGIGVLVTQEASKPDLRLRKPFISATPLNGDIPRIPFSKDDYSLKTNFASVIIPQRVDGDIKLFKSMFHFKRLHVGVNSIELENIENINDLVKNMSEDLGVEIIPFPIYADNEKNISRIDPTIEAFYLLSLSNISTDEKGVLIAKLNEQKIPTFSVSGPVDVQLGVLATNKSHIESQLVRRVAMNLYKFIEGVSFRDIPVLLISDPAFQINAKTAMEIGYRPDFIIRANAAFINIDAIDAASEDLHLGKVFELSELNNKSLAINKQQIETSLREMQVTRGGLYPQIDLNADYTQIDYDGGIMELFPEGQAKAGVSVNQMLYDDRKISNYRFTDRKYESAEYDGQTERLNVLSEAGVGYYNYLLARSLFQIARSNLRLTEGNLNIARMREEVGHSGKDEVYRWQAEVAGQKGILISAESDVEKQMVTLNQLMGISQDKGWKAEEIDVFEADFFFLNTRIDNLFRSRNTYEKFKEYVVQFGLDSAPELKSIDKYIEGYDILLGQRQRSYFLPVVGFKFNYDNIFYNDPANSNTGNSFGSGGYYLGFNAKLPLFEGSSKIYDVKRQEAFLYELDRQKALIGELVEKRLRNSFFSIESSFPNIMFRREAAENTKKNLNLVREKYVNGIVNITDLLVAQSANFVAEQAVAVAVHEFLMDMIILQRSIAFMEEVRSEEEKTKLLNDINDYIDKN